LGQLKDLGMLGRDAVRFGEGVARGFGVAESDIGSGVADPRRQ
jgi:hypothetical protein